MCIFKNYFDKLFEASDKYLKKCRWTDLALLKFCLCAVGILIGLSLPKEKKKGALLCAALVFTATWIPLMSKFLPILIGEVKQTDEGSC